MEGFHYILVLALIPITNLIGGSLAYFTGRGYNGFGRAMKSLDAQYMASRYLGKKILIQTPVLAMLAVALIVISGLETAQEIFDVLFGIYVALYVISLTATVVFTELKLRQHFDKNGRPYV